MYDLIQARCDAILVLILRKIRKQTILKSDI